jgi:hypothetical protein
MYECCTRSPSLVYEESTGISIYISRACSWPTYALLHLSELPVGMKVTLHCFVAIHIQVRVITYVYQPILRSVKSFSEQSSLSLRQWSYV